MAGTVQLPATLETARALDDRPTQRPAPVRNAAGTARTLLGAKLRSRAPLGAGPASRLRKSVFASRPPPPPPRPVERAVSFWLQGSGWVGW